MTILESLTAHIEAEYPVINELFEELGLFYTNFTTTEINVSENTGILAPDVVDKLINNQSDIWVGQKVVRIKTPKKIIVSDTELLFYLEAVKHGHLILSFDTHGKIDTFPECSFFDKSQRKRYKFEFEHAIWVLLLQNEFEIYLWNGNPSCLQNPIRTYQDLFIRYPLQDETQYQIADKKEVKKQLIDWGEVPDEFMLIDTNSKRRLFFQILLSYLVDKNKPPNIDTRDWDTYMKGRSYAMSDNYCARIEHIDFSKIAPIFGIKILDELIVEQLPDDVFYFQTDAKDRVAELLDEIKHFNDITNIVLNSDNNLDPWPLDRIDMTTKKWIHLSGYFQGGVLDLSNCLMLKVLELESTTGIRQLILPKQGQLLTLYIHSPDTTITIENFHLQTSLKDLKLHECNAIIFDQRYHVTCPSTLTELTLTEFGTKNNQPIFDLSACHHLIVFNLKGGHVHEIKLGKLNKLRFFCLETAALNKLSFSDTNALSEVNLSESEFIWDGGGIKESPVLQDPQLFWDHVLAEFIRKSDTIKIHGVINHSSLPLTPNAGQPSKDKFFYDQTSSTGYDFPPVKWIFKNMYKHLDIRVNRFTPICDLSESIGVEAVTLYSAESMDFNHIKLPKEIKQLNILTPHTLMNCDVRFLKNLTHLKIHAQSLSNISSLIIPMNLEYLDIILEDREKICIDLLLCKALKEIKLRDKTYVRYPTEKDGIKIHISKVKYAPIKNGLSYQKKQGNHQKVTSSYSSPHNIIQYLPFNNHTGPAPKDIHCELKFTRNGKPISKEHYRLARYKIFNAVNEEGAYYVPGQPHSCTIRGLDDACFERQQHDGDSIYGYDHLTLSSSEWTYIPGLFLYREILLRQTILDHCEVAYFPDRDQYGIKLKTICLQTVNVEYYYLDSTNLNHFGSTIPFIPVISDGIREQLSGYHNKLPIKPTDGIKEIVTYCKHFSVNNTLQKDVPLFLQSLISQAGSCQHAAMACLILCAYQRIPCRLVINDIHGLVELYNEVKQCWKQCDLGGSFANVNYITSPLPKRTSFYKAASEDPSPDHASNKNHIKPPSTTVSIKTDKANLLLRTLFVKIHELDAQSTIEDFVSFLNQHTHCLLRYKKPQFVSNLNRLLLQNYLARPNANPRLYVYISNPKQLKSLFKQCKITEAGTVEELDGPLKKLISEGGLLFINWSNFSASEKATYKSILDYLPTLHDQDIHPAVHIINTEQLDSIIEDDSFYSRMQSIVHIPIQLEARHSQLRKEKVTTECDRLPEVYLYEDKKHWQEALCGKLTVDGCRFQFQTGALLNALKMNEKGIVIYGAPKVAEFDTFIQDMHLKKEIMINGDYYAIPDGFQIVLKDASVLTTDDVIMAEESISENVLEVNSSIGATIFSKDYIDTDGYVHHDSNSLFTTHKHFVVTTLLDTAFAQQLLHLIQKENKTLSIRKTVNTQPLVYGTHSGIIFTTDPAFIATKMSDHFPATIPYFVDLNSTWNELIETVAIQSHIPLRLARKPTLFLDALTSGKTVIFYGQMNLNLYQRLSSLFNQQHYFVVNGEKIKPSGNLIFVTTQQTDHLYTQAVYQEKKIITLDDYQAHFLQKYNAADVYRLIFIYRLAQKNHIKLPLNVQCMNNCLRQLSKQPRFIAREKVIKSILLINYSHESEEYAFINIVAKLLFSVQKTASMRSFFKQITSPYDLSKKRYEKLQSKLQRIHESPWQVANCLTNCELRACFHAQAPITEHNTFFTATARLSLDNDTRQKIQRFCRKILKNPSQIHDNSDKNQRRLEQFLQSDNTQVLIAQGDPGVGKTYLINELLNNTDRSPDMSSQSNELRANNDKKLPSKNASSTLLTPFSHIWGEDNNKKSLSSAMNIKKFWGRKSVLDWLESSHKGIKLLILDEYNLNENAYWSLFENLDKGYVYEQGKKYPVSNEHKIFCTCNPSYYPERKKQMTLPAQAITLYFKHPHDDQLRAMILKQLADIPVRVIDCIYPILLTAYHLARKDHPNEISIRDLLMLCQRFQYLKSTKESESNTKLAQIACVQQFLGMYSTVEKQHAFQQKLLKSMSSTSQRPKSVFHAPLSNSPKELLSFPLDWQTQRGSTMANNNYIIPPTQQFLWDLILDDIALLRAGNLKGKGGILIEGPSGIGKTRIYIEALRQLNIPYYLITAGSKNVKETLQKAFPEPRCVILDELNLDPSLEVLLGQYLTGVDEFGVVMETPGFFVLASQNSILNYADRKKLAPSLLNRFHHLVLPDLTLADLHFLAEKKLANQALAQVFVTAFMAVKQERLYQINTRDFFIKLDAFEKLSMDEQAKYDLNQQNLNIACTHGF